MPGTTLPMREEIERALNRVDFFRLFRSVSTAHEFDSFGLVQAAGDISDFTFVAATHLHSWTDPHLDALDDEGSPESDALLVYLFGSIVPKAFHCDQIGENASMLMSSLDARCAVVIPLHTPSCKRFGLVLLGDGTAPNIPVLAGIAFDAALVLQRYYEIILSLESVSGLSESEIQIVRWTSEGSTTSDIARNMGRSEHTINSYVAAVLRKLQVANRAQMVAAAIRRGLIN